MAYTPTVWDDGDLITKDKLNKIENGLRDIELTPGPKGEKGDTGAKGTTGERGPAGPAGAGLTGAAAQLTKIADTASATAPDIAAKVNAVIDQLIARGISKA